MMNINSVGAAEPVFDTHLPNWAVKCHTDTEFSPYRYAETPKQLLGLSVAPDTHTCTRGRLLYDWMLRLLLIG